MSKNVKPAYPARNADDCVDSLKIAFDKTKKTTDTRQEFADGLNMTAGGGAYNVLVGSLSSFRFVETGNGQIVYTDLGKKATFGKDDEVKEAKREAVANIPIFRELYNRYGASISDDQIRIYLKNDLGVDMQDLDSYTEKVSLSLKSNLQYLITVKQDDKKSDEKKGGEDLDLTDDNSVLGTAQALIVSKFGRLKISDEETLAMARMYLGYIEKQLKETKLAPTKEIEEAPAIQ